MELDIKENWKELGSLFFLYMGKLNEYEIIAGGSKLTPSGFDIAMMAYEDGLRLTEEQIVNFTRAEVEIAHNGDISNEELIEAISSMIIEMQKIGFEKFKQQIEEIK